MLITGMAGLVAGALSMAAGNTSPSARKPTPSGPISPANGRSWPPIAKLKRDRVRRNLHAPRRRASARKTVALQLMAHDALAAHAHDELGISNELAARPLQAALASAATFAIGAALPIVAVVDSPDGWVGVTVASAFVVSRGARRIGGPGGWGVGTCGCGAGGILGRSGDGCHIGRWHDV